MNAGAQLALKYGMASPGIQSSLTRGMPWSTAAFTIFTNVSVMGGLAVYVSSAILWLLVLSRVEVSLAYPFVGLGFILTMMLAWLLQGEALTIAKLFGTLLISAGVAILATR